MIDRLSVILLLLLLGISEKSRAQERGWLLGAEGGAGITALTGTFGSGSSAMGGYSGGIVLGYDFGKRFSLRSGVYYDLKGTAYSGYRYGGFGPSEGYTGKASFHYLSVPLLARLSFGGKTKFFISGGPYVGYLLSMIQSEEYASGSGSTIENTPYYSRSEFGLQAGPGISHSFGRLLLSLEARNSISIMALSGRRPGGRYSRAYAGNLVLGMSYRITGTNAQEGEREHGLILGLEGGAGIRSLQGKLPANYYYTDRTGYSQGVFVQYDFKRIFSLRSGIYYDKKGVNYQRVDFDMAQQTYMHHAGKADLDYLTLPLLARLSVGHTLRFFVNAGPYVSFLLSATDHDRTDGSGRVTDLDRTAEYTRTDAGLAGGIGFSYQLKQLVFSLEARDCLGLTAISASPLTTGVNVRTNTANVLVGLGYKFGKKKEAAAEQK